MRKNLLVLFGGKSSEHYISLESGYTVLKNIDKEKYNPLAVGITKTGKWKLVKNLESIKDKTWENDPSTEDIFFQICGRKGKIVSKDEEYNVDIVFPMLHGKFGEDGTVQGMFELLEIPIVGPKTLSSALSMDKYRSHKLVDELGILTPKGVLLENINDYYEKLDEIKKLNFPLFVKPLKGGSSIGISKITNIEFLRSSIESAFEYDDKVLVEEKIEGFEVFCAIMGNDKLTIGELEEIELFGDFLNSNEKHSLENTKIHIPARISKEKAEEIKTVASNIYKALDCETYARVDVFLSKDGNIYFNEVNTTPGFTKTSAFPMMMNAVGMDMKSLISNLIELAN